MLSEIQADLENNVILPIKKERLFKEERNVKHRETAVTHIPDPGDNV